MDESSVREHANQHANAVMSGDMGRAGQDLTKAVMPTAPQALKGMPQPITSVEVTKVEQDGAHYVAHIAYRGDGAEHVVASRWEDQEGRPMIVELTVVGG
jgi:hypothetical protein